MTRAYIRDPEPDRYELVITGDEGQEHCIELDGKGVLFLFKSLCGLIGRVL